MASLLGYAALALQQKGGNNLEEKVGKNKKVKIISKCPSKIFK